jgi:Mrp family chromosome partitioning ATPase
MTASPATSVGQDPHEALLIAARIASDLRPGQILLCCGLGDHEGVGESSLALARALADMTAWRVLLVDTQGAEATLPDMPTGPGFSDLIGGAAMEGPLAQATGHLRLHLVGPGTRPELIGADAMLAAELPGTLAALKKTADVVILIGAPIRRAAATASLARHVDATVLFSQLGRDRRDDLARAVADFAATGTRLLGTVVLR